MDVREKLEVIAHLGDHISYKEDIGICYDSTLAKVIEDAYMELKNGVTIQEWISVKDERKPKYGEDVLVVVFDGYDTYTDTDCLMRDGKWCFETENHKVTHWRPIPQPPKGE